MQFGKKIIKLAVMSAFGLMMINCSKTDSNDTPSTVYNDSGVIKGSIQEDVILSVPETSSDGFSAYALDGFVTVDSGVTLTIDPGVMFKSTGKSALIIMPGAKIIAKGTKEKPIVFTSSETTPHAGDWAGIVIFGRAPVSSTTATLAFEADENMLFGGSKADDNSGVLQYVRIEYAGYTVAVDKELNGLTLGGVGTGTTIDHIQSHMGSDDAYEWFGGTVNTSYLIATEQADDGFDIDEGYTGHSQYMIQVQGVDSDHGIEAGDKARNSALITSPTWSNITLVVNKSSSAVILKNNVSGIYEKMVIVGDSAPSAIQVSGDVTLAKIKSGTTKFTNSFYSGTFSKGIDAGTDTSAASTIAASVKEVGSALNTDLTPKDAAIIAAKSGAIVDGDKWYDGWSVHVSTAQQVSTILGHVLSGTLHNGRLVADTTYELSGFVYVDSGYSLTIDPGTQIKSEGKSALIVRPGAKLIAKGTRNKPIVFTSKKTTPAAGDWAGVVLFGRAPVSSTSKTLAFEADENELFGGSVSDDSSGVMEYVRIEYAGYTVAVDKELNSLTLGGVGSKTVLRYIQTHKGSDDAYEWFGGTTKTEYLIATEQADDGFDIDEGYNGTSQYMLQVQGVDSDHGIEAGDKARDPNHITAPKWSNITLVVNKTSSAVILKNNVSGSYEKMVIVGDTTPIAIEVTGAVTLAKIKDGSTSLKNSFYAGVFANSFSASGDASAITAIENQVTRVTNPLNSQLASKNAEIVKAGAGAIPDSTNLWHLGWTTGLDNYKLVYNEEVLPAVIEGTIKKNSRMVNNVEYELKNFVYVDSGATLYIEKGTTIKSEGKSALIVRPGGKIIAKGTKEDPIVFTSKKASPAPGDWAGVVLFGRAPVSSTSTTLAFEADENELFGGTNVNDSSGVMEYVRIEYAGYTVAVDKELNSLTLGGVGAKTVLRYIQCHKGSDDAYEWFGGNTKTEYLIATEQADDGFDIDEGYNGTSQYMIQLQGVDSDHGIEAGDKARNSAHITAPMWSNITLVVNKTSSAIILKNNVSGMYEKMVVIGDSAPSVVEVTGSVTLAKIKDGTTSFANSYWDGNFVKDFNVGSDLAVEAVLAAEVTPVANALAEDLSPIHPDVIAKKAGAIVDSNLWYKGWSVGINYKPISRDKILPAILTGKITGNSRLVASTIYELQGFVYVDSGAVLTVEPGTQIKSEGKSALIVRPRGKIIARGTMAKPIVFTSKKTSPAPSDWAGIVIFGRAPVSSLSKTLAFEADENELFGGTDSLDNSGILEYVRIEYAGYTVAVDKELNGLTLGGVGAGTRIRYIQSHKGSDDAYEWFGGTVNSDHLIATEQADDGFDIDEGYKGTSQYMIQIQGVDSDHGIEAGNKARDPSNVTSPKWSNITLITNKSGVAFQLKDNVTGWYKKMVIVCDSTPAAVELTGAYTLAAAAAGTLRLDSSFISGTYLTGYTTATDTLALANVKLQVKVQAGALNADLTPKASAVQSAGAGAILGASDLWYKGWTVAMP